MPTRSRPCPECRVQLERAHRHQIDVWECPGGHGVGVFLTDAWGKLQRDELDQLWATAKSAPVSSLLSPVSGERMLEVTFSVDEDTQRGSRDEQREITIEVDSANYFGWFQIEELQAIPRHEPGRGPDRPGLVGLDEMDQHHDQSRHVFTDMEAEDFLDRRVGASKFFSDLADRLRPN